MKAGQIFPGCENSGINPETNIAIHPDFPDYYVTDDGLVISIRQSALHGKYIKKISSVTTNAGYTDYVISDEAGLRHHKYAHRLVAECFIPNPDGLREVNHKDFDKTNNRVGNLEWMSHKDNQGHAAEHDRWKKIKGEDRKAATEMIKAGMDYRQVAEKFDVSYSTVVGVAKGSNIKRRPNTPIETRLEIIRRVGQGELPYRLAKEYGLTCAGVVNIVKRGTPKRK
jgi:hypothetical protein